MNPHRAISNHVPPAGAATAPEALEPASGAFPDTITLTLPWPPAITHQNGRPGHFMQKAAATNAYKKVCADAAWNAGVSPIETWTVVSIEFRPPNARRRDLDGMIGNFKAGQDGLADAMGADDADFWPTYLKGNPVPGGAIVAVLRRLEIPG